MLFKNLLRYAALSTFLFALAGFAAAQGPVVGTSTTSELAMSANVQTAVQLNISTDTGNSGATVSGSNSTGLFSVNFGNVNGLGLGTPTAGVSVSVDGSGATYSTPVKLTPVYSGFTTETATVTVEAGSSADQGIAREGNAANSMTSVTSTPAEVFTGAASESNHTRYVGFRVARTEAAGAKEATFIYTVTVE
ncbi:MAG: hypothetical protein K1X72_24775 [Pyrinomonadaceae bacterium]|nr:hypothetical protein [Pyrinomonadaceae bacterium]